MDTKALMIQPDGEPGKGSKGQLGAKGRDKGQVGEGVWRRTAAGGSLGKGCQRQLQERGGVAECRIQFTGSDPA